MRCRKKNDFLHFPAKIVKGLFHVIGIAKVLLTPKRYGVAKFRECELPQGGDTTAGERSGGKIEARPIDDLNSRKCLSAVSLEGWTSVIGSRHARSLLFPTFKYVT